MKKTKYEIKKKKLLNDWIENVNKPFLFKLKKKLCKTSSHKMGIHHRAPLIVWLKTNQTTSEKNYYVGKLAIDENWKNFYI